MKKCALWIVSPSMEKEWQISAESVRKFMPEYSIEKVSTESAYYKGIVEDYPYSNIGHQICAARPRIILDHLKQYDQVVFLGSDVVFFETPVFYEKGVTVFPHVSSPVAIEGALPTLPSIIKTGHINSDIVCWNLNGDNTKFLEWQADVHKQWCIANNNIFLDQTWLNCLPFFVDHVIINRNPGYNLAYFNTKERVVTKNNGRYEVNGERLVCVQFSGYQLGSPEKMSKHCGYAAAEGELLELFTWYEEKLK